MKPCKRVAIVGAGFCGLGCIKALKEDSIEPVCFEKSSKAGGTWSYREEAIHGTASTMSTTTINHSKEMGSISNHVFPEDAPNYMRHDELFRNIKEMGKKFDLLKHITCNREVINVVRAVDYEKTGRWVVTVKNTESGEFASEVFDGVMICVGHLALPEMPTLPGMKDFEGRIIHTHSLKTFESFKGERVLVVGTGCSALDAAAEISNVASQVYLSVRTPSWIMPRVGPHGLPFDYVLLRRYITLFQDILPVRWASKFIEYFFLDSKFNHRLYGIKPKCPFLCRDPIINDTIPAKLLAGTVVLRNDIGKIEKNGVIFEDEGKSTVIDTIIMATGYTWDYSFIEDGILVEEKPGKFLLYKNMYPTHLKHPTLAFIGFLLPFGPGFPIAELQTRWASYLMSGKGSLPSQKVMIRDVEKRYEENAKRYSPSSKMSVRVDYIPYMNEIASQFAAKPNFWKMAFTDPRLFIACIFGPCLAYQYRLQGPHKWDGAREAILMAPKRVKTPLCGKDKCHKREMLENSFLHRLLTLVLLCLLFILNNYIAKCCLAVLILLYFLSVGSKLRKLLLSVLLIPYCLPFAEVEDYISVFFVVQIWIASLIL